MPVAGTLPWPQRSWAWVAWHGRPSTSRYVQRGRITLKRQFDVPDVPPMMWLCFVNTRIVVRENKRLQLFGTIVPH